MIRGIGLSALVALALLWDGPALAQGSGGNVNYKGPITPGDCTYWVSAGLIADSGVTDCGVGGSAPAYTVLANPTGSLAAPVWSSTS